MAKPINININIKTSGSGDDPKLVSEPWNGEFIAGALVKEEAEQRYTLTVAYPVNKPDVGIARDGHQDFAGPDAIEKAAWAYLRESPVVGQWHEDDTEGAGDVVESYIWRFDDQIIKCADGSEYTITKGDWLLGVVWGEDAWDNFKKGKATGVSMQGKATRKVPTPADVARLRNNR